MQLFSLVCPRSSLSKFNCCFQPGLHNQSAITSCGAFEILNDKMALLNKDPQNELELMYCLGLDL